MSLLLAAGAAAPPADLSADDWPWGFEAEEDQWPDLLESGPVVADVAVVASQPPEDAWNWTADDVDLVVIPGGYAQPYISETPLGDDDEFPWWDATDDAWWDYLNSDDVRPEVVVDQPTQLDWIDDPVEDDWITESPAVDPGDMPAQIEWDWAADDVQQTIVPTDQQAENEPPHPQDHDWFDDQLGDPWEDWLNADDIRENATAAADQPTDAGADDDAADDAWPDFISDTIGADAVADQPPAAEWPDEDIEDESWLFQTETFAEQLDRQQFDESDWDVEVSDELTSDFPTSNEDQPQDDSWPWFDDVDDWWPEQDAIGADAADQPQEAAWLEEEVDDWWPEQDAIGADAINGLPDDAWLWADDVEDQQPDDATVGADSVQADQPQEAAWLEEEVDDWAPENDQIGADAINALPDDAWPWIDEVEDQAPADDGVGADAVFDQPTQDEWDWSGEVDDDFLESPVIDDGAMPAELSVDEEPVEDWWPEADPVGADALVDLASAEAWEWALEQEDDQRVEDEPIGADEPPLFVDAWPWGSADDTDDWWPEEAVIGPDEPPLFVDGWPWESADDTDDPPPPDEPIGADQPPLFVDGWYWDEEPAGDDDWWAECPYILEDQQRGLTYTQDWDWVEDDTSDDDWWQWREEPQFDNVDLCPIFLAEAMARIAELEALLAAERGKSGGGGGEGEDYFRTRYRWATRDERIRRNNALILALVGAVVHGLDKPEEPTK